MNRTNNREDNPGDLIKYHCSFCKNDFEAWQRKAGSTKRKSCSNQIKCPRCGNFQKTW